MGGISDFWFEPIMLETAILLITKNNKTAAV